VSFRLLYNKILTSTTVLIECISWLIEVTNNNDDARWKPEIERNHGCLGYGKELLSPYHKRML
jgi:hypothetical protein